MFAFTGNLVMKASSSFLFILIGRMIGPADAGMYNLGITFFTIVLGLSAFGLHELLVRELAPRRDESGHYAANYLFMRLTFAALAYAVLLLCLRLFLPYSAETKTVIVILSLAVFGEATFNMLYGLFAAHERLAVPTIASFVNSGLKLGIGLGLLYAGAQVTDIAWALPIGSTLSLLIFIPPLIALLRKVPQSKKARLDLKFCRTQLAFTTGFILIYLFSLLDFQTDTFLISLYLDETEIGYYGAAQTIMLAFWLIPVAIRTAIYPLMARYHKLDRSKLVVLHEKASQYLLILGLPLVVGVCLLAEPLIHLVFGEEFNAAVPALQWLIWAVLFSCLNVPNARLMLVHNKQKQAGWITGISMIINVLLNLWLIRLFGIVGAGISRTLATFVFFIITYLYVRQNILRPKLPALIFRPALATLCMVLVILPVREINFVLAAFAGIFIYGLMIILLRAIPAEDWAYWRQLYHVRVNKGVVG